MYSDICTPPSKLTQDDPGRLSLLCRRLIYPAPKTPLKTTGLSYSQRLESLTSTSKRFKGVVEVQEVQYVELEAKDAQCYFRCYSDADTYGDLAERRVLKETFVDFDCSSDEETISTGRALQQTQLEAAVLDYVNSRE
jgi:hypothetical protein